MSVTEQFTVFHKMVKDLKKFKIIVGKFLIKFKNSVKFFLLTKKCEKWLNGYI